MVTLEDVKLCALPPILKLYSVPRVSVYVEDLVSIQNFRMR